MELPKHDCFFKEFEIWQKKNNYPKGGIFYKYPSEMNYINKILQSEIPIVTLKENGNRKEFITDVDDFASKLTENVERME